MSHDTWANRIPVSNKSSENLSKEAFFAAKYYKNLRNMLVVGDTSAASNPFGSPVESVGSPKTTQKPVTSHTQARVLSNGRNDNEGFTYDID